MSSIIAKCEGLVLRNLRYGDTSRVATLFTDELGKISVIGKGVRQPKSPFGASLELFTRSEFVLYYRQNRNLQMLKSGDVEVEYPGILADSLRYSLGCGVLEFIDRMLLEDQPIPELFLLACRALEHISEGPKGRLVEVFRAFQLRSSAILGYSPMLEECLHCSRSLEAAVEEARDPAREIWCFLIADGGAICPNCRMGGEGGQKITARGLLRVRAMTMGSPRKDGGEDSSSGRRTLRGRSDPAWTQMLDYLVEAFLLYHVERYRGLRSLASIPSATVS